VTSPHATVEARTTPAVTGQGLGRHRTHYRKWATMTAQERARLIAMYGVIAALHVAGFVILFAFVVPSHYQGLGVGVAVLGERQGTGAARPLGFGFFFSLGHSTVVVAIGAGIVVAEKTVFGAVSDSGSGLERFGSLFGTVVSAAFLLLIGLLNLVVLAGIVRVFASMRRGEYDEAELERQLANRGFSYRFFGRWMAAITKEWQLYPVGVVFGLGFDTATEVALLATTALLASQHIPWYAIICLPVLFTAGMTFLDTTDGLFMNLAYGWAFFTPVRKVYYNLAITGFWGVMYRFNINTAGFVIVGMFLATWLVALLIWRFARIEEKWKSSLDSRSSH
jgi:high-affinity nickel-transport protein